MRCAFSSYVSVGETHTRYSPFFSSRATSAASHQATSFKALYLCFTLPREVYIKHPRPHSPPASSKLFHSSTCIYSNLTSTHSVSTRAHYPSPTIISFPSPPGSRLKAQASNQEHPSCKERRNYILITHFTPGHPSALHRLLSWNPLQHLPRHLLLSIPNSTRDQHASRPGPHHVLESPPTRPFLRPPHPHHFAPTVTPACPLVSSGLSLRAMLRVVHTTPLTHSPPSIDHLAYSTGRLIDGLRENPREGVRHIFSLTLTLSWPLDSIYQCSYES